jgi:DNA integrity scanning protein DisA with diadenylate cyclase activity
VHAIRPAATVLEALRRMAERNIGALVMVENRRAAATCTVEPSRRRDVHRRTVAPPRRAP